MDRSRAALGRFAARLVGETGLPTPDPAPELDYLFVVTYARSGSTLLQGLLNALPGVLVRGENGGAVHELYRAHAVVAARRSALSLARMRRVESPWFGLDGYDESVAYEGVRRLVLDTLMRPEADTRTVGFKEVRWNQPDLEGYVDFLERVFPRARFVFNSRNLEDVALSGWWADQPGALEALRTVDARHRQLRASLGDAAFAVEYDAYRDDPEALRPLVTWLGREFDGNALAEVLARPHSWSDRRPVDGSRSLKGA